LLILKLNLFYTRSQDADEKAALIELERLRAAGKAKAPQYAIVLSLLVRKKLLDEAITVFQQMGATADEAAHSLLAKAHSEAGDHHAAMAMLKAMVARGIQPKLRTISPLLSALCARRGDPTEAYAFWLEAQGMVTLTESEDATLLAALAPAPDEPSKVSPWRAEVLHRFRDRHGGLSKESFLAVTARWPTNRCVCHEETALLARGRVKRVGLDAEARLQARGVLKELANQASPEEGRRMAEFESWLLGQASSAASAARGGPFDYVVDGPNVGYFMQAQEGTGLSHRQIDLLCRHLQQQHPEAEAPPDPPGSGESQPATAGGGARVLVVMPKRYLGGSMPNHSGIHKLKRRKLVEGCLPEETAEVPVPPEAQAIIQSYLIFNTLFQPH